MCKTHYYFCHYPSEFGWGDPHFKSVDNRTFTFNGMGEYILIRTPSSLGFSLQARLERFDGDATGTVMTSIAVKQGDAETVQVVSENGEMNPYIGGTQHELSTGDSPLVIGESGVVSSDVSNGIDAGGDPMTMAMMSDMIFVRRDESGSIVVSTAAGASVSVVLQSGYLEISVSVPGDFINLTSGLLGTFNGDPSDDFRLRNGTILMLQTEEQLYQDFGLQCE
jgi:hypothetical protein